MDGVEKRKDNKIAYHSWLRAIMHKNNTSANIYSYTCYRKAQGGNQSFFFRK